MDDPPPEEPAGPDPTAPTRRTVLGAGLAVAAAAGAGVGLGSFAPLRSGAQPQPPAELSAALAAEDLLLGVIDASIRQDPSLRAALALVRRDHSDHAAALRAAIAEYPAEPSPVRTAAPLRPLDRAGLQSAEQAAAEQAATRAAALGGRNAALLASIAACEASHAELL